MTKVYIVKLVHRVIAESEVDATDKVAKYNGNPLYYRTQTLLENMGHQAEVVVSDVESRVKAEESEKADPEDIVESLTTELASLVQWVEDNDFGGASGQEDLQSARDVLAKARERIEWLK